MNTLPDLINGLKELMNIPADQLQKDEDNPFVRYYDSENDAVSTMEGLACELLISAQGRCNWDNISEVKKAGFDVYAGDKDSFGWLTGCISIQATGENFKRVLVYG